MISVITPSHDVRWLEDTYRSLKRQTHSAYEWVVFLNGKATGKKRAVEKMFSGDERVRVVVSTETFKGIGAVKKAAFSLGRGDVLVELDHDDLLTPDALAEVWLAFTNESVDFVYSDFADFNSDGSPSTYGALGLLNGWQYRDETMGGKEYKVASAWEPTAASMSQIFFAPNHVRAWRRSFYEAIGGHDPSWPVCDDHELLVRTYLNGKMKRIPKCLYLYRMGNANTHKEHLTLISLNSNKLYADNIDALVRREMEIRGLPCYDLGGGFNCPEGWASVDLEGGKVKADLTKRWPWPDGAVGAFRAFDFLEHLPDKLHVIKEMHRCLAPGGWILSLTPSTDGRGAFMDPTHVAFYNENSFLYYTEGEMAKYIGTPVRFMQKRLVSAFPSKWHLEHFVPYVTWDAIALKDGMDRLPGLIEI